MNALGFTPLQRVAAALVFGAGAYQTAAFSGNQHTYLLHAVARSVSELRVDPMVEATDPQPLFTMLAEVLLAVGGVSGLYAAHAVLAAILYFCVTVCVRAAAGPTWSVFKDGLALVALVLGHTYLLRGLGHALWDGAAGQYILRNVFQPCTFGAFLVAAVAAFVSHRQRLAFLLLCIAPSVHPTYLLPSAALAIVFFGHLIVHERQTASAVLGLVVFVLGVTPIAFYVIEHFVLLPSELRHEAARILVRERIPHHALPEVWLSRSAVETCRYLLLFGAGIYLGLRAQDARLRSTLLGSFVLIGVGVLGVSIAPSDSLSLLFPWRISVVVFPVVGTWLVVHLAARVGGRLARIDRRVWGALGLVGGLVAIAANVRGVVSGKSGEVEARDRLLAERIKSAVAPARLLAVVPPELRDDLRLLSGTAVYADWKSHPYRADEVLRWWERVERARRLACQPQRADLEAMREDRVDAILVPATWPEDACDPRPGASASDLALLTIAEAVARLEGTVRARPEAGGRPAFIRSEAPAP